MKKTRQNGMLSIPIPHSAVKTNLEKMIENNNLHKFIHEISIPVEKR